MNTKTVKLSLASRHHDRGHCLGNCQVLLYGIFRTRAPWFLEPVELQILKRRAEQGDQGGAAT